MAANPVGGGGTTPTTSAGTTQKSGRPKSPIPLQPMNTRRRAVSAQNRTMNLRRAARAISNRVRRAFAGGPASGSASATRPTTTARPRGRSRAGRP